MADAQALLQLQAFVDEVLQGRTDLRVLDAGCGSSSYVRAPETAHRVGIDISEEQLRKNTFVDEKILGDIQVYQLPSTSFDVIICWWVLEHLREPTKVLSRFREALRENGIMVLAVPQRALHEGAGDKGDPLLVSRVGLPSSLSRQDGRRARTPSVSNVVAVRDLPTRHQPLCAQERAIRGLYPPIRG